jgi:hypothetical protein
MNIFVAAAIISFVFFLVKFIEMRFIKREDYPLKILVKDSLIVFFSVIIGHYIVEQIKPVLKIAVKDDLSAPEVFVGNPDF